MACVIEEHRRDLVGILREDELREWPREHRTFSRGRRRRGGRESAEEENEGGHPSHGAMIAARSGLPGEDPGRPYRVISSSNSSASVQPGRSSRARSTCMRASPG